MADLTLTLKLIATLGAPSAKKHVERSLRIQSILRRLGLQTDTPPTDFAGLYAFALVNFGVGKPKEVVEFFADRYVQAAYRRSFEERDDEHLLKEADELYAIWNEAGRFKTFDYDPRQEIAKFSAVFDACVVQSRTVAESELHGTLTAGLTDILQTLMEISTRVQDLQTRRQVETSLAVSNLQGSPPSDRDLHPIGIRLVVEESALMEEFAASLTDGLSASDLNVALWHISGHLTEPQETVDLDICVIGGATAESLSPIELLKSEELPGFLFMPHEVSTLPQVKRILGDRPQLKVGIFKQEDLSNLHLIITEQIQSWISTEYRRATASAGATDTTRPDRARLESWSARLANSFSGDLPIGSSVDILDERVTSWFTALGYSTESHRVYLDGAIHSIVNVPQRRGFDRVLVVAFEGEVDAGDVQRCLLERTRVACDEVWLVANSRISPAARAAANSNSAYCYTFDELIEADVDFQPYLDWLKAEVTDRKIDERFVQLACTKTEFLPGGAEVSSVYDKSNGWMTGYVDRWLGDPSKEHVSILGEFGTGKSWFALHYAWSLAQQYEDARRSGAQRPRLPIVVPLRDYAKAVSVESLFSEFFFRKHNINLRSYKAFEQLNRFGKLLLIFDGFDEMAARVDRQAMINNFWQLSRVVVPGAKAILTCRAEHFPTVAEERQLLGARLQGSTVALTGNTPRFEQLHVQTLNRDQVRDLLSHSTDASTVDRILNNPELTDLLRRPIMAELILDALPDVEAGRPISLTRVYLYAIRRKMDRDISQERTFTSLADKLLFLAELSWEMFKSDNLSINYRLLPDLLTRCFGNRVQQDKDLDHWQYDMLGQTILIRTSEGDYGPAHRSFLEFFVSFKLAAAFGILNEAFTEMAAHPEVDATTDAVERTWNEQFDFDSVVGRKVPDLLRFGPSTSLELIAMCGDLHLTPVVVKMVSEMATEDSLEKLLVILCKSDSPEGYGSVVKTGLALMQGIDPTYLTGRDLRNLDWSRADLDMRPGAGLDLSNAQVAHSSFVGADLDSVNLAGTVFSHCDLTAAQFLPSEQNYAVRVAVLEEKALVAALSTELLWSIDLELGRVRVVEVWGDILSFPDWEAGPVIVGRWRSDAYEVQLLDGLLSTIGVVLVPSKPLSVSFVLDKGWLLCIDDDREKVTAFDVSTGAELWSIAAADAGFTAVSPARNGPDGRSRFIVHRAESASAAPEMREHQVTGGSLGLDVYSIGDDGATVTKVAEWQGGPITGNEELQNWILHSDSVMTAYSTVTGLRTSVVAHFGREEVTVIRETADRPGDPTVRREVVPGNVSKWAVSERSGLWYLGVNPEFPQSADIASSVRAYREGADAAPVWTLDFERRVTAMSLSADEKTLAVALADCDLLLVSAFTGEIVSRLTSSINYKGARFVDCVGLSDSQIAALSFRGAVVQ